MTKDYQISEEDIDAMVVHLTFTEPENATREYAKAKLEKMQSELHALAHTDPEKFAKLQAELDAYKQKDS